MMSFLAVLCFSGLLEISWNVEMYINLFYSAHPQIWVTSAAFVYVSMNNVQRLWIVLYTWFSNCLTNYTNVVVKVFTLKMLVFGVLWVIKHGACRQTSCAHSFVATCSHSRAHWITLELIDTWPERALDLGFMRLPQAFSWIKSMR